jgi:hypothetical protein
MARFDFEPMTLRPFVFTGFVMGRFQYRHPSPRSAVLFSGNRPPAAPLTSSFLPILICCSSVVNLKCVYLDGREESLTRE